MNSKLTTQHKHASTTPLALMRSIAQREGDRRGLRLMLAYAQALKASTRCSLTARSLLASGLMMMTLGLVEVGTHQTNGVFIAAGQAFFVPPPEVLWLSAILAFVVAAAVEWWGSCRHVDAERISPVLSAIMDGERVGKAISENLGAAQAARLGGWAIERPPVTHSAYSAWVQGERRKKSPLRRSAMAA